MEHEVLIKKFKQEIKQVLERDLSEEVLNKNFTSIKSKIDKDVKEGYFNLMSSNLALGIGIHGGEYPKQLILNGNTEGWKYITRYLLWSKHIIEKRGKWFDVASRNMGSILAFSLLWNMNELKLLIRSYFQEYYNEEKENYRKKESHHLFVALLFDLFEQGSYEEEMFEYLPENSIYRDFLENWRTDNKELYKDMIFRLCDAHIYSYLDVKIK